MQHFSLLISAYIHVLFINIVFLLIYLFICFFISTCYFLRGDYIAIQYGRVQQACGVRVVSGSLSGLDRCQQCAVELDGEVVGVVDKEDGVLSLQWEKVRSVKEIRLVVQGGGGRSWLVVRRMVLVLCGERGGGEEL